MSKIAHKTKIVVVPEKGQQSFKQLASQYKGKLLWLWAVYADKWLSDFMDRTLKDFNPPKAIDRELQGFFVKHNGSIAIQIDWKEPKK